MPSLKDSNLDAINAKIVRAVAAGKIIGEGQSLAALLEAHRRMVETMDLEKRVVQVEEEFEVSNLKNRLTKFKQSSTVECGPGFLVVLLNEDGRYVTMGGNEVSVVDEVSSNVILVQFVSV